MRVHGSNGLCFVPESERERKALVLALKILRRVTNWVKPHPLSSVKAKDKKPVFRTGLLFEGKAEKGDEKNREMERNGNNDVRGKHCLSRIFCNIHANTALRREK